MFSNKISPNKLSPQTYKTNPNTNKKLVNIFQKDEILISINKLSILFKNYIKELKSKISKKNIEISFIDNSLDYAYTIVNNIIKHNYSYEQLQSLEESLMQIKEKNNNNKLDLLNEEKKLILFFEKSDKIMKDIITKKKQKLEKVLNQIKEKKSLTPNNVYKNSLDTLNKGSSSYNLVDIKSIYKNINNNKRNVSEGNLDNKKENENIKINSTFNDKNINLNLIHLTPPIYNIDNKYNIDINKEDAINSNNFDSSIKKISQTEMINNNNSFFKKYELLKKQNFIYGKNIQNLKKELSRYKSTNLFDKNNLNISSEISSKNKQINLLKKENENLRKKLESIQSQSKMRTIKNKILVDLFDNDNFDNINDLKNNTLHSFNLTDNGIKIPKNINIFEKEVNFLKQEKIKLEKLLKEQNIIINKNKYIEKELNIIKIKLNKNNLEFIEKKKKYEIEMNKLNDILSIETKRNEELNSLYQNQKIKYEYEISQINDKRAELSKLIANKNNEIIKLQKELVSKNKEVEEYKLLIKNNNFDNKDINKIKKHYENIIYEKNKKEIELNNRINIIKNENNILYQQNEKLKNEINDLNKIINDYKDEIKKKNIENDQLKNNDNLKEEIVKFKDENEGLKEFIFKIKEKEEKIVENYQNQKEKYILIQKENEMYKKYFTDKKIDMQNDQNKKEIKEIKEENYDINNNNLLIELNNAKQEINSLKKKNEELFKELESRKFVNQYCEYFSEGKIMSNYEEEFDLKKMAKGAKDKNRSQDINIDYPGAQQVKEKYRELDFYYNSLEELVKKLLLNCTCTNKNKKYITELCKIVGFEEDVTSEIINNKSKKGIDIFGIY